MNQNKVKIIERAFYIICTLCALTAILFFARSWWQKRFMPKAPEIEVTITGNVKNPGRHRIPWGSNLFDLLQVAGVKATSNLNNLKLEREVANGESVDIGQLDAKVNLRDSYRIGAWNIDYYKGAIEIMGSNQQERMPSIGLFLNEGDRISCMQSSQAQLKARDGSIIDIGEDSKILLEKIAEPVGDKKRSIIYIERGKVYSNIVPLGSKNEIHFKTPHIIVMVRGTEFTIDVTTATTQVKLFEGMAYVQSLQSTEGINIVSGQKLMSTGGATPLRAENISTDEEDEKDDFRELQNEQREYTRRHRQINILFCGIPSTYIFFKMEPAKTKIISLHIPANTWVGNIVEGFWEFDKAYLYGGPKFTLSIVERLLHEKMDNFVVYKRYHVESAVDLMGGISVEVDPKAASYLYISSGAQTINGAAAAKFMAPSVSGIADARERQKKVLYAIFSGLRDKNIILSTAVIAQLLTNVDANISAKEALDVYSTFNSIKGWEMKTHTIPGKYFVRDGVMYLQPSDEGLQAIMNP